MTKEQLIELIIESVKKELQDTNKKINALVDYLGCEMKKEKFIDEVNPLEQFGNLLFGTPGNNSDTIDYKYTLVAKPKVKKHF
jgi:nucleoid DNA-binding protein